MNKQLASLLCLVILVTMPACRKKSKEEKREERENISTMIEIDGIVEEEKEVEAKKSIIKF